MNYYIFLYKASGHGNSCQGVFVMAADATVFIESDIVATIRSGNAHDLKCCGPTDLSILHAREITSDTYNELLWANGQRPDREGGLLIPATGQLEGPLALTTFYADRFK